MFSRCDSDGLRAIKLDKLLSAFTTMSEMLCHLSFIVGACSVDGGWKRINTNPAV